MEDGLAKHYNGENEKGSRDSDPEHVERKGRYALAGFLEEYYGIGPDDRREERKKSPMYYLAYGKLRGRHP